MKHWIRSLVVLLLCAVPRAAAQHAGEAPPAWSERTLELAASLPIQDGGRIKPLSTFASFTLLRLNGMRRATSAEGARQSPTEWLLDLLFFPEHAARSRVFLVQNAEVIEALGVPLGDRKKRDRWSYAELEPGLPRLFSLAHEYSGIPDAQRTSLQAQVVFLAENVLSFARLSRMETLAVIPPVEREQEAWSTPSELAAARAGARAVIGSPAPSELAALRSFDALSAARGDAAAFEGELANLHGTVVGAARARGEYERIELEVAYYDLGLISWSLMLFVGAFLAAAMCWLRPKSRIAYVATAGATLGGALALVAAIALRCVIRGRPPVSTLYETVIFVTAVGVLVALAIEWIQRQRIAVSAAALLGMLGLFVANGYEVLDKQDTMPSLVAVLDTNFWLATHVTAITIGYSAGMLAALLGSVYLVSKALGWKRSEPSFGRSVARMTYGVLCFGMIFATVGTILGGIWANESWGRFWGWDPKENGALMIVITQIAILHGRMGGYLRDHGICAAAAFGGTVVAFSWWGVNLLGVGLHSYGFTSGIHTALWTYYAIQWGIVGLGTIAWFRERAAKSGGGARREPRSSRGDAGARSELPLEAPQPQPALSSRGRATEGISTPAQDGASARPNRH